MYLKALELQGFKSFPEKTVISFDQEVTAIVGPNGSGKSNISDALLWVMGEQRARAFRGAKMEDVIFGGTEKRGSMGFAQVSLILDNTARTFNIDSDELNITRRYYRSGESVYSINRENVRLKDIQELLMDTGLGRDGYSIIGQGRIAEIVSAKSTDRREIFEEAAGIARFRHRKEDTEHQLSKVEDNLLRIGDKIEELELQVGPLKQQSETAKKYLILHDELRELEISLWLENLDQLHEKIESLNNDFNANQQLKQTAQDESDRLYAAADNLAERARELELRTDEKREELRLSENMLAETEKLSAVIKVNLKNNSDTIERLQNEITNQTERNFTLRTQIEEKCQRLTEIDAERVELAAREREVLLKSSETESGIVNQNLILRQMVAEESDLERKRSELLTEVRLLNETKTAIMDRISNSLQEKTEIESRKADALLKLRSAEKACAEAEALVIKTGNMVSGRSMLLEGRERDCLALAENKNKLMAQLQGDESRLSVLRDMEKELRGYSDGAKAVMRESSRGVLKGIHGPLSRLIHTEDRYALAVETALGAAFQNIVVDTQRDAKNALDYLKHHNAGRTTFLPMDRIRGRSLNHEPSDEPGYIGICSELVSCNSDYRAIVEDQLGITVVAETLQDAMRISDHNGQNLRIVTLDGQLINPRGSMTGGSAVKSAGFLSRANEIEKLINEIESLKLKIKESTLKSTEADRKLEKLRLELDDARENNAQARQEQSRQQGLCEQARILLNAAGSALDEFETTQLRLKEQIAESISRIELLQKTEKEICLKISDLRSKMETESKDTESLESIRSDLTNKLNIIRNRDAALISEKQSTMLAEAQLEELRMQMEGEETSRHNALTEAERISERLSRELQEKETHLIVQKEKAESVRDMIEKLTEQKLSLESKRTANDKAIQAKNAELMEFTGKCAILEQKKVAADMEEKQIIDKLWDSYELSRSAAQEIRKPIENYSKSNKHASELRRSISALGNPNLGAIDEYARVSERYEFLTSQRADVLKSKSELVNVISSITSEMEMIFVREFNAINEAFRETFLELFGGGKARLSLEDEDDVLNCGIDIKIQPPGKALSNISLLSGGEKAFVAIALYFAIMKIRPTPFCIMDEIESALDEANVALFAEYLHRMSGKTQFIVITHRRGTMESADELYGVTMQEKGVSTVLSVNVTEAEKTIH